MATLFAALWTLLASVLLAGLTAWFQLRNWRNQDLVRLKEKEQDAAVQTASRFASLVSRRIYRQKRFLWSVRKGHTADDDPDVAGYRAVLIEWNESLREIEARLAYSFGHSTMSTVEADFHSELARIHEVIEAARRAWPDPYDRLAPAEGALSALGSRSAAFTKELMRRARDLDLSAFEGKDRISFRNRTNLTAGYLFFRLFGVVDKSR